MYVLRVYDPDTQPRTLDEWLFFGLIRDAAQRQIEFLRALERVRPCLAGHHRYVPVERLNKCRRDLSKDFESLLSKDFEDLTVDNTSVIVISDDDDDVANLADVSFISDSIS